MATHLQSTDTPVESDVPVWVTDHWEYQPVAVTTTDGLAGDGTAADAVVAITSGEWGVDWLDKFMDLPDTEGKPIYIDTAGLLRAAPDRIIGPKAVGDLPSTYPPGLSMMWLDSATAGAGLWGIEAQMVLTMRRGDLGSQLRFIQYTRAPVPFTDNVVFRRGDATGWKPTVVVYGSEGDWVNLTGIAAGWTTPTGPVPSARQHGTRVQLRGRLVNSTFGGSTSNYTTIAQLPAGINTPLAAILFSWAGNSAAVGGFQVTTSGAVQFYRNIASGSHVDFGAITFIVN